jgi:membrane dipeptidase
MRVLEDSTRAASLHMTSRRDCLKWVAVAPFVLAAAKSVSHSSEADYARAIVIDGQGGLYDPYSPDPYGAEDPQAPLSARALAEMRQSGQTATSFTVNEVGNGPDVWSHTIHNIAAHDLWIGANSDILLRATASADIRRAKTNGSIAVIYNTQDTSLVGADLERITLLKGLGVRVMQLTYNNRNLSGDGCLEPGNAGLSQLGRATIARIEKEKLLLDLSHSGQRTVAEAIAAATRPMTISHTGCRSLSDHPRNQWDPELKACADKGGVVGIFWMPFLTSNGRATSADLLRHMKYAVNVCGEEHVAVGTDSALFKTEINDKARAEQKKFYEERVAAGVASPGEGPDVFNILWDWDSHMRFKLLADGLAAAGWTTTRIEKVLGGNLLRLYAETWEA